MFFMCYFHKVNGGTVL